MGGPATADQWVNTFLMARAAETGATTNTQLAYGTDLKDVADWLANNGGSFATASRADIERYLIHCYEQGLAKSTRARRLSAIKQLYRFALEENWRDENPAFQIKGPGREKQLPKTLNLDEVDRLLAAARQTGRTEADRLRNTCLMEVLYATGMRVTEMVTLPASAARGNPRMLMVTGKGGKERMVPLSPPARQALVAWLGVRDAAEKDKASQG
ncbi:MAG: site-specific integrase, partial [Rhodobacteraceae bacterium]|nr:site-specific integrase [Paracoccaceae bacterium]